jgi:hypothetical protein
VCLGARTPLKTCKLTTNKQLQELVADRLAKDWSPQQISGWLAKYHEADTAVETTRDVLKRELKARFPAKKVEQPPAQQPSVQEKGADQARRREMSPACRAAVMLAVFCSYTSLPNWFLEQELEPPPNPGRFRRLAVESRLIIDAFNE